MRRRRRRPARRDAAQAARRLAHAAQEFVDTNVTGTLNLLEEAVAAGVGRFVFTSTTSAFGRALTPPPGAPAAWITEDVAPVPRNIYGVTKAAAEDLCELVHRDHGLPCLILRTSRFFPEADDRDDVRAAYDDANLKVNELLYRRVDLEDVVERAPARARARARRSASAATSSARPRRSPATTSASCARDAPAVVRRRVPGVRGASTRARGWRMFPTHRARLRQRRAPATSSAGRRATTSATRSSALAAGEDAAQRARARGRRQGLPRRVDRAVHDALTARRARRRGWSRATRSGRCSPRPRSGSRSRTA